MKRPNSMQKLRIDARVLYEDEHLIALYKPPGILSQSDQTGDMDLLTFTRKHLLTSPPGGGKPYLGLVHRLDRPAAGVMLFGKNSGISAKLSEQFRLRETEKIYLTVVHGKPPEDGFFSDRLLKDKHLRTSRVADSRETGAKHATLSFKLLGTRSERSLVEVFLHSGRSHQIRVQFSNRGFPVLADRKYGSKEVLRDPGMIALWAKHLSILHPVTGRQLVIHSPRPRHWPWYRS
jgi:23S rRNA pseudouridine1911/1915/1917 synthase